jgi:UDP-perosamine 4-acetyltransferase
MNRVAVVIVGAGGHSKVIVDILEAIGSFEVVGFTSPSPADTLFGYRHLGPDSILPRLFADGVTSAFPAVGDNRVRRRLMGQLRSLGFLLPNAISPRAVLSPRARLGSGIAIMPGAVLNADASVDDGAVVNTGATVDHDCQIGAAVHLAPGTHLAGNVVVGLGSFLGIGCSVISCVLIGSWVTVGAGAAVIRDIPDHATVVGVPSSRRLHRDNA